MPPPDPMSAKSEDYCGVNKTRNNGATALSEVDAKEAKRITDMEARISTLESQIEETRAKKAEITAKLKDPDAHATVSKHIKLLHKYNEIRDIGQGLMGLIADQRGVRIVDVYEEFGVAEGD